MAYTTINTLQHKDAARHDTGIHHGKTMHHHNTHELGIYSLGMTLGLFIVITFTLCVIFDLLFPAWAMYPSWIKLLPGFTWISPTSFLLGLIESFAYGWYIALVFVPLYNFFRRT